MGTDMMKLWQFGFFMSLWLCSGSNTTGSQDWDFLVYSQKWPMTFCSYYKDHTANPTRTCILPENKYQWTIHGLWPSKYHGEGPFFCNASAAFDRTKILPIENKLKKFWPNLEGDSTVDSLWKHEWEKHGTCALNYEPLNDELKYFKKGLIFYGLYNMTSILSRASIFPDKNKAYYVRDISDEVKKSFGKVPYVDCVKVHSIHKFLLSEIRLCFNKDLEAIDCVENNVHDNLATNCSPNEPIFYPKDVTSKSIGKNL